MSGIDAYVAGRGGGGGQQAILYVSGEAAARAGAPVCLPPLRAPPSSASVTASARPMKGCHGNTPQAKV